VVDVYRFNVKNEEQEEEVETTRMKSIFWHTLANYLVLDEKGILRFMEFALFRLHRIVFKRKPEPHP